MQHVLRRSLASAALALTLLSAHGAYAAGASPLDATPAQSKQALDKFLEGKNAFDAKKWDAAITAVRASLDIVDSPNARIVLARAIAETGKTGEAWAEYGRVVASASALAPKAEKYKATLDAANAERAALEAKLSFVIVSVAHDFPGSVVKAGGHVLADGEEGTPVAVPPGPVDIVVENAGKQVAKKTVTVALGEKTPVTIDAAPDAGGGAAGPATPGGDSAGADQAQGGADVSVSTPSDKTKLRPYAYIAGGVGAAGLVTFAIFGLLNNSTYSDLQSACGSHACPPDKQDQISTGRTQQTIANIGLVVGAVGAVAGGVLWWISRPPSSAPSSGTAVVVGPGWLGVRGAL